MFPVYRGMAENGKQGKERGNRDGSLILAILCLQLGLGPYTGNFSSVRSTESPDICDICLHVFISLKSVDSICPL